MKLSWGHKIAAIYILFVAGILTLVYKASSQTFDLVTENYYEQELRFQNVIDQQKAVLGLSGAPRYVATQGTVQVLLPAEFEGKAWTGDLYLYRPSDAKLDIRKEADGSGRAYVLVLPRQLAGNYTLKFAWECDGKKYYDEKTLTF